MKKHSDLAFKFRKHDDQVFYKKTVNNFLNSEHKIIYAKKRANNFLNNAEQKIILCKIVKLFIQKTVNNFYEKTMNNFN